jgi:endonuclease YncB( thermonuclease family)
MVTFRSAFVLSLLLLSAPLRAAEGSGAVRVVDGDTLWLGKTEVRLFGIDSPEAAQTCERAGEEWGCGAWATEVLRGLVAGRDVSCDARGTDRYGRTLGTCRAGGVEVNRALVRAGAAIAYRRYSTACVADERVAQRAGVGIWAGSAQVPEDFRRAADATPASAEREGGCRIKGNISANGRIYHRPGQEHYAATGIDPARGERWFCTEAEARAAGWRAARR